MWIAHPELADHVDCIAVHMLPYWEGVDVELAVDYVAGKMDLLKQRFPGKPIVIGEVGWPSEGRTRESAVASQANQALFLRRFLERAGRQGYTYYLMDAFDQSSAYRSGTGGRLTPGQRYHFVAGWLPWLAGGCGGCRPRPVAHDRRGDAERPRAP